MIDYEKLYVLILYYLRDSELTESMGESAIHAEQITEIVKENLEEELSDGT